MSAARWLRVACLSVIVTLATLSVPTPASAFNDNFEDGDISDWTVQCGGWQLVARVGGGFAVAATQLDNVLIHSTLTAGYGHYHYEVYFPDDNRADGDLIFQIVASEGYWILLGPDNSDNGADRIIKVSNFGFGPGQQAIGCAPFHLSRLTWHTIDIYRFSNGVIRVFMDNEATPRMEAVDTSISSAGKLALRAVVAGVQFDNVSFDPTLGPNPQIPGTATCASWGGLNEDCALGQSCPPSPTAERPMLRSARAQGLEPPAPFRAGGTASVPSAANCTVDPCLVLCPAADFRFHVTVRDASSVPVSGSTVTLDFSACTAFPICAGSGYSVNGRRVSSISDGLGRVTFSVRMGGTCSSGSVRVYASGDFGVTVLLATRALASPDQDGNLIVEAADMNILQSKVSSSDPTADLDCSGLVTQFDAAILNAHNGHNCCTSPVGVGPPPVSLSTSLALSVWPNPMARGEVTNLEVLLPGAGTLVVGLYDIAGRRVDRQLTGTLGAGHQRIQWRAPEAIRAGLYSLRVISHTGDTAKAQLVILSP